MESFATGLPATSAALPARAQPAGCAPERDEPVPRRPADCPVERWLGFLGHRWNALLLWHLGQAPRRHGELAAVLPGISPKVLAERLRALVDKGLVHKQALATFPRTVRYRLTPAGRQAVAALDGIERMARALADPGLPTPFPGALAAQPSWPR